jgi:hypothetical protein
MRAGLTVAVVAVLTGALTSPARAYLELGTEVDGRVEALRWPAFPVRYFVASRDSPTASAADLASAVARAFATWEAVPGAALSADFVGFTSGPPLGGDDASTIGFQDRPDLETTLAATTFGVDAATGEIRESDVFFNSAFGWSASDSDSRRFDLEAIALHEIGHLFGLGHSALGETELLPSGGRRLLGKQAVMFPIAFPPGSVADRTLQPDDRAGITDLYGSPDRKRALGSAGGRVRLGGTGVFGAHVTAFNPATGVTVGTFSLTRSGEFVIGSLEPGVYVLRAEPLDDADLDGFFDDSSFVNTNFRPAFAPRLVSVPAGGTGPPVEIDVVAR